MEFDHVGGHCAAEACNQRDFLPFTCSTCKETFCLAHRSALAHNCSGADSRDVTSIDCPICSKSIRMTKADNPDLVWETHFSNDCSQSASQSSTPRICNAPSCRTALGPSNTIVCSSCGLAVCLPHRGADAHHCGGNARNNRAAAAITRAAPPPTRSKPTASSQPRTQSKPVATASKAKKKTPPVDPANTLRGTAGRRMKSTPGAATAGSVGADDLSCPQCGQRFADPVALVDHTETAHASSGREQDDRCPHCRAVFSDPVQLVQHVESAHNQQAEKSSSDCTVA